MLECSLDARGISKRYDAVAALTNVDIAVPPGVVHGLLGPNGAGKTTLLRVLLGLVAREAGTVRLLGVDPDARAALPDGVAGFADTPSFYPYLSGRANLSLLDRLDGQRGADRRLRVDSVLERTGLARDADVAEGRYSAGMRQRLGLASVLLRRPRLLLLDEPTSAIDPGGARDVRALLHELAAAGAAVLFSSHDLESVEQTCRTISVLDRGRVIFSGAIEVLRGLVPPSHLLRTSDNARALRIASSSTGVRVRQGDDDALVVHGEPEALDRYVIALGCSGVAVRHLEPHARSLESLFLHLTSGASAASPAPPLSLVGS